MIRKSIKRWFYDSCPGFAGSFPYFGTKVYFPNGSLIFRLAFEQGVFEREIVNLLLKLYRTGSYYFDVGANIGLMALPVLSGDPDSRVVSFEPSPNALPWLTRTIAESPYRKRWSLVPKAVGAGQAAAAFSMASKDLGVYDGLKATNRAPEFQRVTVEVTTLDIEWASLGKPDVSVIKVDVEGGELDVLKGGLLCIGRCRPYILTEWNRINMKPYGWLPESLLTFAAEQRYRVFALPRLMPVGDTLELGLQMLYGENFLLAPTDGL